MMTHALSSLGRAKRTLGSRPIMLMVALALLGVLVAVGCSSTPAAAPAAKPAATTAPAAAPTTAPAAAPTTAPAAAPTTAPAASAPKKGDFTIVLSNSYLGNAWRKTMVANFEEAAKAAVAAGEIKSYSVQNTAQNTATEQVAQLQSLILQKPSAICINAASPTALNPAIEQAVKAGIKVVVFDSLATAPDAYTVAHDFTDVYYRAGSYIAKKLNGQGNIVEVRGVTGSEPDLRIHDGYAKALKENPGLKVVGTVHGEASQTTTAQALQGLIPSLPKVDAVFNQGGGDAQGVIQAFQNANRPVPLVVLDGGGNALTWYQTERKTNPNYETISVNTMPSQSTIALWMAIDLLNGEKVPQHLNNVPPVTITADNLDQWVKATPPDGIASPVYSHEQADALFQAALAGKELPLPPNPKQ